jgi:prolyl-tRNA editing enzyme YbaK/EbsC (Cys-tRNA(Pro) deacylase)
MNLSYNILRWESKVSDPLEVWVDQAPAQDQLIVFRAGSHVEMFKIKYDDYVRLVNPKVGDFNVHL